MSVALVYDPSAVAYDFGPMHPMRPERFAFAVDLARDYGLLGGSGATGVAALVAPAPIAEDDLLLVHTSAMVEAVRAAGHDPMGYSGDHGIGPGDTPAFADMHEVALGVCAATSTALDLVLDRHFQRSFSPAGGLHHAHRDRAAGFCVYNDCAVAIARAIRDRPGLRVAYIDIDAHHGDGVQEAFYRRDDVLTVSLHESGVYLYPGTGFVTETGEGAGAGYSLNVPLPPGADDECYRLAFDDAVAPAVEAFAPDVIVAQLGGDAHRNDPLTNLGLSVAGHELLSKRIVSLADRVCGGFLTATGGGGYDTYNAVPREWVCALTALLGIEVAEELPQRWRDQVAAAGQRPVPAALHEEHIANHDSKTRVVLVTETVRAVERAREVSPLLAE